MAPISRRQEVATGIPIQWVLDALTVALTDAAFRVSQVTPDIRLLTAVALSDFSAFVAATKGLRAMLSWVRTALISSRQFSLSAVQQLTIVVF